MRFGSRLALAVVAVCGTFSCYRPTIMEGGFRCGDGGACPDGYHCNVNDKLCYASRDAGQPACADPSPMITPICEDPPSVGKCNPACQKGCSCGRCAVSGATTVCTTVGPKKLGETCDLATDDCGAGLGCVKDGCGTDLGRCRKFCRNAADCTGGGCNALPSGLSAVCEPPAQTCDPEANSGCPDPALACYLEGSVMVCDCPGSKSEGTGCVFTPECAPGLTCIGYLGPPACHKVCSSNAGCTGGQICNMLSASTHGFCSMP